MIKLRNINYSYIKVICTILTFLLVSQLTSSQTHGFLLIKSDPEGASVIINGDATSKLTPYQAQLEPGTYDYALSYIQYHTNKGSFIIRSGQTTTLNIELKPNFGSLEITSEPGGAKIYIDDKDTRQKTPAVMEKIQSGSHIVTLKADMYIDATKIVNIEDQKNTKEFIELSANFGTLGIISDAQTRIYVDDKYVGSGSYNGILPEGLHIVRAEKNQHYSQSKNITISLDKEPTIEFTMIPVTGSLSIMCEPIETKIDIDGVTRGVSPQVIQGILVGDHTVTLSKSGYRTVQKKVLITENETVLLNEVLYLGGIKLDINTIPTGAQLFLDGTYKGETPYSSILKSGSYKMVIKKEFFQDKTDMISLQKDINLNIELERKMGNAIIKTYPSNTKVYNGDRIIRTNDTISVFQGQHTLRFEKNGFLSGEKQIVINDQFNNVNILLYPEKYRTKGTAFLLSLIWPGAGQTYLRRGDSAHFLFGLASYGLLTTAYLQYDKAIKVHEEYSAENDPDLRAELKVEYKSRLEDSKIMAYTAAGVWGMNIIWTLLSKSEERRYPKLELKYGINSSIKGSEVGFAVNF